MKAVLATSQGAVLHEMPVPEPASGQILVKVHSAGLNRADLGTLKLGQDQVIGMEWSGTVSEVGPDVEAFKVGDPVMCSGKQAFAEYAVADCGRTVHMPSGMDFRQAAGLTLALQTAHDAVVTHGRVQQGDTVLIHGAAAGVGLMAAKIARLFGAKTIIGTSRDAQRRQALQDHGIDLALDSSDPAWVETVMEHTEDRGVNVIIDHVSGPGFNDLIKVAAILGRIVNVGRLGGANGSFDFETHALKRLTYTGVTFRTRSQQEISQLNAEMVHDLESVLQQGKLALPLDQEFPLEEAQQALDRMAANQHFGKITLKMSD